MPSDFRNQNDEASNHLAETSKACKRKIAEKRVCMRKTSQPSSALGQTCICEGLSRIDGTALAESPAQLAYEPSVLKKSLLSPLHSPSYDLSNRFRVPTPSRCPLARPWSPLPSQTTAGSSLASTLLNEPRSSSRRHHGQRAGGCAAASRLRTLRWRGMLPPRPACDSPMSATLHLSLSSWRGHVPHRRTHLPTQERPYLVHRAGVCPPRRPHCPPSPRRALLCPLAHRRGLLGRPHAPLPRRPSSCSR